jgi:putative aldouronate transport system permease protein
MYHKTLSYRIFNVFNHLLLAAVGILCLLPLVHTLAVSLSGRAPANANLVTLYPIDFTWDAYQKTLDNPDFLRALWVSVQRTAIGTVFGMAVTVLAAYPLSKTNAVFKARSYYTWYFIIVLLFHGGMIPTYIVVQKLGLINSIWALILPSTINIWLLVIMLSFFRTVPASLEEAAFMDGANQFRILWSVYLPISLPAVATLSLFFIVSHWNSWFDGLIYLTQSERYPLATFLQTILVEISGMQMSSVGRELENISNKTVKSAQIFIGALPVIIIYPFLQKFFVKGMVLGAVKE